MTGITTEHKRHHFGIFAAQVRSDMSECVLVRDWDSEAFQRRVLQLETRGYVSRLETYRVTPETNPETGEVLHLRSIEMILPEPE